MQSFMKFRYLFLIPFCFAYTIPALADIVIPQHILQKNRVKSWQQKFPGQTPGRLDIRLAPNGKELLLRLTFNSPADYSISLDGQTTGSGQVNVLDGTVRTARIPLAPAQGRERSLWLKVDYTLYGVEKTPFGIKRTDEILKTCTLRSFTILQHKGQAQLREDLIVQEECAL